MTQYSFRARIMILMLLPTGLIMLLLSAYFMINRHHELEKQVVNTGSHIIQALAVAGKYAMALKNKDFIKQLVNRLHRQNSNIVKSIAVFNSDNILVASSNDEYHFIDLKLPEPPPIPKKLMLTHFENSLILRMAITSDHHIFRASADGDKPSGNRLETNLGYVAIDLDLRAVRLQKWKESLISGLLMSFCLCIAMLCVYRLICDLMDPIQNMINTVHQISRGQLRSRVTGKMRGELNTLKDGINSMAISLSAYRQKMQQNVNHATSNLRKTLKKMEIQNIDLTLAQKKAQEAAQIKSEFLANMSHELRTPLNSVIGFARQTLKTSLTPTQTDYVQTIKRSADYLLSIINDILDFSKLDAKKLTLEHIPFELRKNLDEVVILLAHSAHEKGLELILKIHHDVPNCVIGDPMRFQQIITNLLGNAIKFTDKGHIIVQVHLLSKEETAIFLRLEIQDTGIGIAHEQKAQLFQAFLQADASIARCHGGTGLGLAITKKLVKAMQGEIDFSSQVNQGSTFRFHIKLDFNQQTFCSSMTSLAGKSLAYIETNPVAAQATLDILRKTPLTVIYATSLLALPKQNYDFALIGVPIPSGDNTVQDNPLTMNMALADEMIFALPSQFQVDTEKLKQLGAKECLIKPISSRRLFPLLFGEKTRSGPTVKASTYSSVRLSRRVMAIDDNPAHLKLMGALLEPWVEKTILCINGEEALSILIKPSLM